MERARGIECDRKHEKYAGQGNRKEIDRKMECNGSRRRMKRDRREWKV